jgi:predicted N-acetyltransferase YhbS
MGEQFPISVRLLKQNIEGAPSFSADDSMVVCNGDDVAGFIVTKRFWEDDPLQETMGRLGWIEAMAVDPARQGQGVGRDLLAWATYRLRSQGAQKILLGAGFRHFFPGVPAELTGAKDFFGKAGFSERGVCHDLRGNLRGFVAPPSAAAALAAVGATARPCETGDIPALHAFLQAEFPGRWRFDTKRFIDRGGDPGEIIVISQGAQVLGFAHIYHWRGSYQGPPIYWHTLLGRRYGGLGPIGVAAGMRGKGLGLALLQLGLEHLARKGVENAVIDWTGLVDFYGRVGFTPWKTYARMEC